MMIRPLYFCLHTPCLSLNIYSNLVLVSYPVLSLLVLFMWIIYVKKGLNKEEKLFNIQKTVKKTGL